MNMKRFFSVILLSFLFFSPLAHAQTQDFKTLKSIDIFHGILKELSLLYVDSVQIDRLVYTGINSMLASLDPYTEFFPEESSETLEMLTTGSYGGIGALIRKEPGKGILIVEPFENSPAHKSNIVAGDTIMSIDGESVLPLSADRCTAKLKGNPGTTVEFSIKKICGGETRTVTVVRERVHISDIALSALLDDKTAYIRLSGFTQGCSQEFKETLQALKAQAPIERLVLDLRGNGGGLLEEAVKILSFFVPKNTLVVRSKGRLETLNIDYRTHDDPIEPAMPIIVLVNRGSASSSEIVAGALQDLDRALIVGQRTFGKGLVQSIRDLNFGANIKITTAKYYIPSGRCVQAIDYTHRNEDGSVGYIPDSLITAFKTAAGRTVYDGGGIVPDVLIESPMISRIALDLYARDYFFDYSLQYYRRHPVIAPAESFRLSDEEYQDFVRFVAAKDFDDRSASEILFEQFEKSARLEKLDTLAAGEIKALKNRITRSKEEDLRYLKPELKSLLEEEIACRYYFSKGRLSNTLRNDVQLLKACRLFDDPDAFRAHLQAAETPASTQTLSDETDIVQP